MLSQDSRIFEKEMDDFINIKQDLFDKWLQMAKNIGNRLLEYLFEKKVPPVDYFNHISSAILPESPSSTSFTTKQLVDFMESLDLMDKASHSDNHDLLVGELTHASMDLEGTNDEVPNNFDY